MDIIKISLNTPTYGARTLNVVQMIETDNELLITLEGKECYDISAGETLVFCRYAPNSEGISDIISKSVSVIEEDENHIIHTTIPEKDTYVLSTSIIDYNTEEDGAFPEKKVVIVSGSTSASTPYFIIGADEEINMFAQDIAKNVGQSIIIKDINGNIIGEFSGLSIPKEYTYILMNSGDCITFVSGEDTCNKDYREVTTYLYTFLPYYFSKNLIAITDSVEINSFLVDEIGYSFEAKFNPFYYYEIIDGKKVCHFWTDDWWAQYQNIDEETPSVIYVTCGETSSVLAQEDSYWRTNIGLSADEDIDNLGSDDTFNSAYIESVESSLIPDIVDYEKLKYIPVYGENSDIATSITFDFHFRKRYTGDTANNSQYTSGNVYADGWYIDKENEANIYWNNANFEEFSSDAMKLFITNSGKSSDLLGYLNFTDNDVYYQKKKLSKSFIRLSFYTSKDPLTQKLLYYSTVFLDGTGLYGKYVNQLINIEANNLKSIGPYNENTKVVFCNDNSVSARVDSEIIITNEYDRTRSSEGFNLYLFADDVYSGNSIRTIYMKVEFNHAGNGKTIPMILWPKENDEYVPLTMNNFIDNLYIPIEIQYLNGKYVYKITNADNEDGNIRLILFEPKLYTEKG